MSKTSLKTTVEWKIIPWRKLERKVFKLQKRIYQASKRGDVKTTRRLQKMLMKSWSAKCLSVRRVTQDNQGKKTAGVDGIKSLSNGKNGYLSITNLGRIQMRGQARTWGIPTTCTIIFRNGKWLASITVQCSPTRTTRTDSVGIDLGCKDAVTLSTGEKIAKPDFIKEGQRKVKVASIKLRRKRSPNRNKKVKGSRRWKRERQQVSKIQRKVARQREDWLHKITSNIVGGNSLVSGEKLNVKGMTAKAKKEKRKAQKSGLNRSILDVGFGKIGQMLEYKLAEAGGFYVESPTQTLKPTQRCAKCWELTPKTLADRVHICSNPNCNHTEDRDVNAAQVNVTWARGKELASLHAESPSSTPCGSMGQLGALRREKLLASA
jgi:putative transposase